MFKNMSENYSNIRSLYLLPKDDLANEVLIPAYQFASSVDCMVGFFSSSSFKAIAPGLATYLHKSSMPLRLVISPHLSDQDRAAIAEDKFDTNNLLDELFKDIESSQDQIVNHTVRALAYLIKRNRIQIKIAFLREALFHPKVWLFNNAQGCLAVHGSVNFTLKGITKNYEQISVSKSWVDDDQEYTTDTLSAQFESLWANAEENCVVINLPAAINNRLVRDYSSKAAPEEEDLKKLFERVKAAELIDKPKQQFHIPSHIVFDKGPYKHQGKAVQAWKDNDYSGILSMATGSGKTITAMIGAYFLRQKCKSIFVVITAPYNPLLFQWEEEVGLFGARPINLSGYSATNRARSIARARRRLNTGNSSIEIIIVSHQSVNSSELVDELSKIKSDKLLIADEVHNLGSHGFRETATDQYNYRLGLSATPVRQYDSEGTEFLLEYFGKVVFEYSLREAINNCLVPYEYHIHNAYLNEEELDRWISITKEISNNHWRLKDGQPDEYLTILFRNRRLILESAKAKIGLLENLLIEQSRESLSHTLVYCTDKDPDQMIDVNTVLRNQGVAFRKITQEESGNPKLMKSVISDFKDGDIQVLTAKRVLDEGVNIPQITRAYLLASTTVERQWVQRRGRLLRTSKETGKTKSVIHDFLVVPPEGSDDEVRSLIKSELNRLEEFSELALNVSEPNGPLEIIHELRKILYF